MRLSTFICFSIIVPITLSVPFAAFAGEPGVRIFDHPVSIRSYGMGKTGTADFADPANVFYNPANLAEHRGAHVRGAYSKLLSPLYEDMRLKTLGVSGGFQIPLANSNAFSFGADLRHVRINYGAQWATTEMGEVVGVFESIENYTGFSLGGGMLLSGIVHLGFGASFKYYRANLAPAQYTMEKIEGKSSTLSFDGGFRVAARLFEESGYLLIPAAGLGYLNIGRDIAFMDEEQADKQPRTLRVGLGLRFESPSLLGMDEKFGAKLPIVTLSANLDLADSRVSPKSHVYGAGFEAAVFQLGFLRIGYIHDKDGHVEDLTYGLGLGLRINIFQGRFDFARVPQADNLGSLNKYGLSMGVLF